LFTAEKWSEILLSSGDENDKQIEDYGEQVTAGAETELKKPWPHLNK